MKNSMDRRGFLRLGAFGTAALAAGTGCGEEALPPAPYEGTPAFRTLGRTGMKITIVSMGAMRTSEPAIFQAAFDKGVNYIDTARGYYMDGRNEGDGGRSAQRLPRPRVRGHQGEAGFEGGNDPEHRRSLSSLKVDYVDLLQLHALSSAEQVMNTEYREVLAEPEVGKDAVHRRDHAFKEPDVLNAVTDDPDKAVRHRAGHVQLQKPPEVKAAIAKAAAARHHCNEDQAGGYQTRELYHK